MRAIRHAASSVSAGTRARRPFARARRRLRRRLRDTTLLAALVGGALTVLGGVPFLLMLLLGVLHSWWMAIPAGGFASCIPLAALLLAATLLLGWKISYQATPRLTLSFVPGALIGWVPLMAAVGDLHHMVGSAVPPVGWADTLAVCGAWLAVILLGKLFGLGLLALVVSD